LAIITVGAHWAAEFEWWAHTKNARHAGISEKTIEAIRRGETPSLDDDVSRAVHGVAHQLATTGHVDDATYKLAEDSLGPARLVELVALCGYYSLISFILNTFDVPLPARGGRAELRPGVADRLDRHLKHSPGRSSHRSSHRGRLWECVSVQIVW
jgi:4-carboxymuconolactone decarboxylase